MLVNTSTTLSYKCPACSTFELISLSIFELSQESISFVSCRCKKSGVKIHQKKDSRFDVIVPCYACGGNHNYSLSRQDFSSQGIRGFVCPHTGMLLSFVGKDFEVRQKLDSLDRQMEEIMDSMGYKHEFDNTRVMLDSLNHIHDIAEQGNLFCECGSNSIDLLLHPDRIVLVCQHCKGTSIISASTNEDFENFIKRRNIILMQKENQHPRVK